MITIIMMMMMMMIKITYITYNNNITIIIIMIFRMTVIFLLVILFLYHSFSSMALRKISVYLNNAATNATARLLDFDYHRIYIFVDICSESSRSKEIF